MKVTQTGLPGVVEVETDILSDHRGAFVRLFCEQDLQAQLEGRRIVQINTSRTRPQGAIRGLHFQNTPRAEMKFVRCLRGRVFDVAVDLRAGSPTFLQWHAIELCPEEARMLVVPEGCAHGFQALAPDSELLYLHTAPHERSLEAGFAWNDPRVGIRWPLAPPPGSLSQRDAALPTVPCDFKGLIW